MTLRLRILAALVGLVAFAALAGGCNTVEGAGRDVQAIGEGTSELAREANPGK